MDKTEILAFAQKVLETEASAISGLIERLGETFETAVERVRDCKGRIVVVGIGKAGIIGQKISATLTNRVVGSTEMGFKLAATRAFVERALRTSSAVVSIRNRASRNLNLLSPLPRGFCPVGGR